MRMASDSVTYPSLIHWLRAAARDTSWSEPHERTARDRVLRCRLGELVRLVDVRDRDAVARVRMPLLRQVALSEWGVAALSDHAALVLLRAEDRLIAADHRLHRLMCEVIEALRRVPGTEIAVAASAAPGATHAQPGSPDKSEYS